MSPQCQPKAKSRVEWTEGPSHRKSPVALCGPSSGLVLWADVEAPRHKLNLVAQVTGMPPGRRYFSSQRPAIYIHRGTQSASTPAAPMFSQVSWGGAAGPSQKLLWGSRSPGHEASVVSTEEG